VIASGRSRQGNTPRPPVVLVGSANARVAQGGVARGPVRLGLVTDEGGFVRLVDRLVEGWGYGAADVLGLSGFLLAHPADVASFVLAAGGLANVDTAQAALSIRALHADGSWRPYVAVLRALMGREGERGFSLTFVEPDDQAPVLESDPRLAALTRREREVLVRLLGGRRVRTIANELYLSESTVRGHLSAAFRKLGVASQVELTERFREGGDQQV
jgi:DNA-binding CsgD family transcriptional regulator